MWLVLASVIVSFATVYWWSGLWIGKLIILTPVLINAVHMCCRTYCDHLSLPYANLPPRWRDNGQNDKKVLTCNIHGMVL